MSWVFFFLGLQKLGDSHVHITFLFFVFSLFFFGVYIFIIAHGTLVVLYLVSVVSTLMGMVKNAGQVIAVLF